LACERCQGKYALTYRPHEAFVTQRLPTNITTPATFGSRIQSGPFSNNLKDHLSSIRTNFQNFDRTGTAVMPYIAAWQENDKTIWYEYVSRGLLALLGCTPKQAAEVFRESVLERHVYKEIDTETQVDEDVLHKEALLNARRQLRNEVKLRGAVEAVYKVQGANGEVVWLKDQATVNCFDQDGIYLSTGVMTVVTKEMEAEAARKRMEKILLKSKEKFWYQATHDDLTGLYNTRYLYRMLEQLLEAAKNLQRPLSLLFFDIDNFKHVVDTHGHLNASRVIREIGATIRETVDEPAFGVAYGGDEFVVVMPGSDRDGATAMAERIREKMRQTNYLASRGLALKIKASFGVSSFPEDALDTAGLLGLADRAMFFIKASGKDGIADMAPDVSGPEVDFDTP
jgi:diguanylate cyclase (GGDEF)-like protein